MHISGLSWHTGDPGVGGRGCAKSLIFRPSSPHTGSSAGKSTSGKGNHAVCAVTLAPVASVALLLMASTHFSSEPLATTP